VPDAPEPAGFRANSQAQEGRRRPAAAQMHEHWEIAGNRPAQVEAQYLV
jgi:hypothetical protein